jgi:hypothetical protein
MAFAEINVIISDVNTKIISILAIESLNTDGIIIPAYVNLAGV